MGMFDTFLDPPKGEENQSKAFGKGLTTYRPGDSVIPQRAPLSEAEYDAYYDGDFDPVIPGSENVTLQARVAHSEQERYIDVAEGIYTGISVERDLNVPLIDHYGRVIEEARVSPG